MSKSYGKILHEHLNLTDWDKTSKKYQDEMNQAFEAVIAEYERRNKIAELRAIANRKIPTITEKQIVEVIFDYFDASMVSAYEAAEAIHSLVYGGQQTIAKYPTCKGINCGCTDGMSHSKECIAEYAAATKMPGVSVPPWFRKINDQIIGSIQNDPTNWNGDGGVVEEKKVETEQQYQDRLLRALRDFG